jgi:hypothetical protein
MSRVTRDLVDVLYSSYDFTLTPTGSSGSPLMGVAGYTTKAAVAYLGVTTGSSGSVSFTGSFDGTNVHRITGSVQFNSGSLQVYSFTYPMVQLAVYLSNASTGSRSGSFYFLCQQ